ncbi:MAG: 2-oxo acid dehydrogenase subunit E2 [Ignavibacteriales bacterium]|nr:2-oxo acid dehydrogenase subunit E2 [Ignavibacteriales bacterium]
MTRIHNFIEKNKSSFLKEDNIKLTYMAFLSYAAIRALKEFPLVNSSIEGENIIKKKNINLGIAVSVEPNGLIVPNIKNADEKKYSWISKGNF